MLATRTKLLAAVGALCIASQASALTIFLSKTNTGVNVNAAAPGAAAGVVPVGTPQTLSNPSVSVAPNSTNNVIYIWAIPSDGDAVVNAISLNLTAATSGVITPISNLVYNQSIYKKANHTGGYVSRWQGTGNGTITGTGVTGLSATAVTAGNGIADDNFTAAPTSNEADETGVDATSGAFLLGAFTFNAGAAGQTDLSLSVGAGKITSSTLTPGSNPNGYETVTFGAGEGAPSSQNGGSPGASGTVADAHITVAAVPEPASLGLLALSAIGLIRRRQA